LAGPNYQYKKPIEQWGQQCGSRSVKHYLNAMKVSTTIFILKELISTVKTNFSLAKRSEVYCFISLKR